MPRLFYPKLALGSIKRHRQIYGPYLGASSAMVGMFYMIMFLAANSGLSSMPGSRTLKELFNFGAVVVALFAAVFLFYTNSFLMKRRKRELGLYNVLGMEKRHIARILGWETLFTALFSLVAGLGGGTLLSKLIFLLVARILDFPISIGFEVPRLAVLTTLQLFGALFVVILVSSLSQVGMAKPIELLKSEAAGEREPRARWLLALLGLVSLGCGYYLALAIEHPLDALVFFLVAVVLVMIGTYLLFTTGSIALLKLLRKHKRLYYRPKPFIAISGMLYRMKQNGVGLANICILSTMVLVTLSTTISLYVGIEDVLRTRYPREVVLAVDSYAPEVVEMVRTTALSALERHGLKAEELVEYRLLSFLVFQDGDRFVRETGAAGAPLGGTHSLDFIPLEDYNRLVEEQVTLGENEVLVFAIGGAYGHAALKFLDWSFVVKEELEDLPAGGLSSTQSLGSYYVVVRDPGIMEALLQHPTLQGSRGAYTGYKLGFDLDTSREQALALYRDLKETLSLQEEAFTMVESREAAREDFLVLYGGLFFLGIFLGTLFMLGTVLIIYYKQITEGYEDRRRYVILRQVGMSTSEVQGSIKSQVLSVFYLPLAAAAVHVAFSFPMVTKVLVVFHLTDKGLFALCTAATFAAFAMLYALVYRATTRVLPHCRRTLEGTKRGAGPSEPIGSLGPAPCFLCA